MLSLVYGKKVRYFTTSTYVQGRTTSTVSAMVKC